MKKYTVTFYKKKVWKGLKRVTQYYWRAKHANGNIVAVGGEGYYNLEDCKKAVKNLLNAKFKDIEYVDNTDFEPSYVRAG